MKVLVIDPIRNTVSWVTGVFDAVCNPVAVEELEASVADHAHGQPDRRVAVQDPVDPALQFQLVGPEGA